MRKTFWKSRPAFVRVCTSCPVWTGWPGGVSCWARLPQLVSTGAQLPRCFPQQNGRLDWCQVLATIYLFSMSPVYVQCTVCKTRCNDSETIYVQYFFAPTDLEFPPLNGLNGQICITVSVFIARQFATLLVLVPLQVCHTVSFCPITSLPHC